MSLQQIAVGQTVGGMQAAFPVESALPEGTPVQLSLALRSTVGLQSLAQVVNWAAPQYGLQPWNASTPFAAPDPALPVLHLRWVKGSIGLPLIVAALSGGVALAAILGGIELPGFVIAALLVVAVLLLAGWILYRAVIAPAAAVLSRYWPWIGGGALAAAAGGGLLLWRAKRRPPGVFGAPPPPP